uniref:FRIGIDA-like protein n=1 Tax=Kalanchoe fedtschenkoi TaxID=63787 RepID=A0A7N0RE41_KALFE
MEEAVMSELKLGGLMRKEVLRELDVLQSMSTSLLVFDLKRKQLESHFDSIVELIERKRDEAAELARVREEEAKVAADRRAEELRLREERLGDLRKGIFGEILVRRRELERDTEEFKRREKEVENQMKARQAEIEEERQNVETRAAECDVNEKEMREAKAAIDGLASQLSEKEKDVWAMMKDVDDLTARVQEEDARRNAICQKLSDENLALREELKSLTQQLELKTQPLRRDEQLSIIRNFLQLLTAAGIINVCSTLKDTELNGKDLLMLAMEHADDKEVAITKVSSKLLSCKDKAADLVVEALRTSYLRESEEQGSQSMFRPCRILLLEQLGQTHPQAKSQVRQEAVKVAIEWSSSLESSPEKFIEIPKFLRFLSIYDIASEFSNEVLMPMLNSVALHEATTDLCSTLGFAKRISGYVKTLIENRQLLKAIEYISAFKLEREFSIDEIVQELLNYLKLTSQSMRKEGGHSQIAEMQVLDFQIKTLKELIRCMKDLKFQSKHTPAKLELRVANLKKQKHFKKRPAPCPNPSGNAEPPRKKQCKLPGTCKSTEVAPKNTLNAYSGTGSNDANPSIDPEPSSKKRCQLPEIAKSIDVTSKDALAAHSDIGSRDALCSNRSIDSEPLRKKGCKPPDTSKSTEVARKDASNAYSETGSRDALRTYPCSNPEPLERKNCNLLETVKSTEAAPKHVLNPFVSRNALHCQEMQRAPFHFDPLGSCNGALGASPYITPSQGPSWYQRPQPHHPPQFHHSYPLFEGYPKVPSWQYPVPEGPPYFGYRP